MKRLMFWVLAGFGQLAGAADVGAQPVQRFTANYGPGCHIAASLPPGLDGGLGSDPNTGLGGMAVNPIPKSWKSSLDALGFGLSCWPSDDPAVTKGLAKFNPQTGLWEKDLDRALASLPPTPSERKVLDRATRVMSANAINSQGYVNLIEDTIGAEEHRARKLSFCLLHPPKAICGEGWVGMLREGRKGDLTPHALKIIRSIEFLPDEPLTQLPDATATTPSTETPASEAKP